MSPTRTKGNLLESLADSNNKVVMLSGKWGTGKTHLWSEVQKASTDRSVKDAVSVSVFGANSIADLKLKVAQKMVPKPRDGGAIADAATAGCSARRVTSAAAG